MVDSPRRLRQRSLARYPYLELLEHDVTVGDGERTVVTIELRDWAVIAARDAEHRWILVCQHRHGIDDLTLEPAGGIIDLGEEPAEAAARELLEETGYGGGDLHTLGWVHPNPGLSGNRAHLFFMENAKRLGEAEQRPDELTELRLMSDIELSRALTDGTITHALAQVALTRAQQRIEGSAAQRLLSGLETHQQERVLALARRLRAGLTADDIASPQDFPELADPDWTFEDGQLAGIRTAKSAFLALRRRIADDEES